MKLRCVGVALKLREEKEGERERARKRDDDDDERAHVSRVVDLDDMEHILYLPTVCRPYGGCDGGDYFFVHKFFIC